MSIRIVDNKKIDMTDDEARMFDNIVRSYTTATNNGEDLFKELFDTDDNGIITMLRPPSKFRTSFEVFLFLMSLMQNQHLRLMHAQIDDMCEQIKKKL